MLSCRCELPIAYAWVSTQFYCYTHCVIIKFIRHFACVIIISSVVVQQTVTETTSSRNTLTNGIKQLIYLAIMRVMRATSALQLRNSEVDVSKTVIIISNIGTSMWVSESEPETNSSKLLLALPLSYISFDSSAIRAASQSAAHSLRAQIVFGPFCRAQPALTSSHRTTSNLLLSGPYQVQTGPIQHVLMKRK